MGCTDAYGGRAWQLACTSAYCLSFIGLGLMGNAIGPTLPPLADRLQLSGPTDFALALFFRGLGYAIGTLVMGHAVDRWAQRAHLVIAASCCVMGLSGALVPWAGSVAITSVLWTIQSVAGGVVDVGGNILVVKVWGDDKGGFSAMNALARCPLHRASPPTRITAYPAVRITTSPAVRITTNPAPPVLSCSHSNLPGRSAPCSRRWSRGGSGWWRAGCRSSTPSLARQSCSADCLSF